MCFIVLIFITSNAGSPSVWEGKTMVEEWSSPSSIVRKKKQSFLLVKSRNLDALCSWIFTRYPLFIPSRLILSSRLFLCLGVNTITTLSTWSRSCMQFSADTNDITEWSFWFICLTSSNRTAGVEVVSKLAWTTVMQGNLISPVSNARVSKSAEL